MRQKRYVDFADAIRNLRKERGMSQRDLAQATGLTSGYIGKIECDGSVPGANKIQILSDYFEISMQYLEELAVLSRCGKKDILKMYPNAINLFQRVQISMDNSEREITFVRFEKRISLFDENKLKLADNFKDLLLGKLDLNTQPKNGLRPLSHYWKKWSDEIEKWSNDIEKRVNSVCEEERCYEQGKSGMNSRFPHQAQYNEKGCNNEER